MTRHSSGFFDQSQRAAENATKQFFSQFFSYVRRLGLRSNLGKIKNKGAWL